MYSDAYRFLAINCVLNGRSLLDAFDSDVEMANTVFGTNNIEEISEKIDQLNSQPLVEREKVVSCMLNLFRMDEYAFVMSNSGEPILISAVAEGLRAKDLTDDVAYAIASQVVRSLSWSKDDTTVFIRDGVLSVPKSYSLLPDLNMYITECVKKAFDLYCFGPLGHVKNVVTSNRAVYNIGSFKSLTAVTAINIVKYFLKCGVPPVEFSRTTFVVPDLLPLYKKYGVIMCNSQNSYEEVDWLIDYQRKSESIALTVNKDELCKWILVSPTELCRAKYAGARNGVVFEEIS